MTPTFENYRLEPEANRFNIVKTIKRTKEKTGEQYDADESLGYGIPFDRCLDMIACDILAEQNRVVSFAEWVNEYKGILLKLTTILK